MRAVGHRMTECNTNLFYLFSLDVLVPNNHTFKNDLNYSNWGRARDEPNAFPVTFILWWKSEGHPVGQERMRIVQVFTEIWLTVLLNMK